MGVVLFFSSGLIEQVVAGPQTCDRSDRQLAARDRPKWTTYSAAVAAHEVSTSRLGT